MASMANKIGMFTMFSTLALGHHDHVPTEDPTPPSSAQAVADSLFTALTNMQAQIDRLESKQITGNYYFEIGGYLDEYIKIESVAEYRYHLFDIEVQEGETIDLTVTVPIDDS